MKKITYLCIAITIVLSLGLGFFTDPLVANTKSESDKRDIYLNIMTVNKSQALLVEKISGNKHNVDFLISENQDVNSFEYTEETIKNVSNMDLFLYTGANVENWTNTFIDKLEKNNLGIINLARGIRTRDNTPNYWLGLEEYKICLYNIKAALQDRDPINREYYESNYNNIVKELEDKTKEKSSEIHKLIEDKKITYLSTTNNFDFYFDSFGFIVQKINKDNYKEVIEKATLEKQEIIIISDKSQELDYDISETGLEPIYLETSNYNKTYDETIIDNYNIIIQKLNSL
ncbi:MAG: metal ABC transporter substrate-binding protein [Clostridium sp.]